jgi:GntR family transcriptional repressor for pyruvate dehydrogenase complex
MVARFQSVTPWRPPVRSGRGGAGGRNPRGPAGAAGDKLPTEARWWSSLASAAPWCARRCRASSRWGWSIRARAAACLCGSGGFSPLNFDARSAVSRQAVVQMVEVRRALEAEVAALAAQRRTPADVQAHPPGHCSALDKAVQGRRRRCGRRRALSPGHCRGSAQPVFDRHAGLPGASSCVAPHASPAPTKPAALTLPARCARTSTTPLPRAIEAGDPAMARRALPSRHMDNAIRRIEQADPAFWQQAGVAPGAAPGARPGRQGR